jgi:dsRNA-specific ribonuclease
MIFFFTGHGHQLLYTQVTDLNIHKKSVTTMTMSTRKLSAFVAAQFQNIVSPKYLGVLTSPRAIKIYDQCMTSSTYDESNNYEYLEQLGDVTANKFLVWYFYRRFPELVCPRGVKVVARLKINYGSKKVFSQLAHEIGFWEHIKASDECKHKKRDDLLEDSFEAFVGATELILDTDVEVGVGGVVAYAYLKSIFDKQPISLKYEDLYDSKTRLKELADKFSQIGRITYKESREGDGINTITTSRIYTTTGIHQRKQLIATGRARLKNDAQRAAAQLAINYFNRMGYVKTLPPEYAIFGNLSPTRIK